MHCIAHGALDAVLYFRSGDAHDERLRWPGVASPERMSAQRRGGDCVAWDVPQQKEMLARLREHVRGNLPDGVDDKADAGFKPASASS